MKRILNKSETMLRIEAKLGGDIEEILRAMYVDNNLSVNKISRLLNISYVTTHKWLKQAGIYSRNLKVGS